MEYTFYNFITVIKKILFLFLIEISFFVNLSAQIDPTEFAHLTTENGLSINNVTSIVQDKKGFIWVGTTNGLNFYDGYNFRLFFPNDSNANSLTSPYIAYLLEDNHGFIWIATIDGLNKYDRKTNTFYRYKHDPNDSHSLSNNNVYTIFQDKENNIWVGTINGLNKYNPEKNNFTVTKEVTDRLNPHSLNSVLSITEDDNGLLWLSTWNGIGVINKQGKVVKNYLTDPIDAEDFDYRKISSVFNDDKGYLWIGMNGKGLKRYDQKTGTFKDYIAGSTSSDISDGYIISFMKDSFGNLWISTRNGLNKYNYDTDSFTAFYTIPLNSSSLISSQVTCVCEDRSGLMWVGTSSGISRFYQSSNPFKYYQYDETNPLNGLSNGSVISAHVDKEDNIWVATMGGVTKISSSTDKITHLLHNPRNSNSVSDNFIRSVFVDHEGIVWIGTNNGGLNRYDPQTGKFSLFRHNNTDAMSISNNGILSIIEDSQNNLWFGTWWGMNKYDRNTKIFKRYLPDEPGTNRLQNGTVWDIFEDSEKLIWIGTDGGGLSRLDPETNTFTHFMHTDSAKNKIGGNRVFTIMESKDGKLWFGTDNGMNSYNRKTGIIEHYNKANGLPGNLVNGIVEDDRGYLWISSDKGLSRFDPADSSIITYTIRNGLRSLEFIQNVCEKSSDGTLYFGSYGLLHFNPAEIKEEKLDEPLVFTDLKIFNQSIPVLRDGILPYSISDIKKITIPPGNEVLTFEFALLDFSEINRNTFRYKLEGFENEWNDIGNRNYVTYTNLEPGDYKLRVRATNNNGIKNEVEASLEIYIVPKFYQTWWFRILFVIAFLAAIILYTHIKTSNIEKRNILLEQKVEERTKDLNNKTEDLNKTVKELNQEIATKDKFFSIIAHDLRSPFTALLGFSRHLIEEFDNLSKEDIKLIAESIYKSTGVTFNLLGNLLQWARIQTGKMEFKPEVIDISELVKGTKEVFSGSAHSKGISIILTSNGHVHSSVDRNMIETVVRNLISNSLKFTGNKGKIELSVYRENGSVKISVSDNGVGMPKEKIERLFQVGENVTTLGTNNEKGSGLGLILCKEFVEHNDGTISVQSEINKGTSIIVTLPAVETNQLT